MNCERFDDLLDAHLDGDLLPHEAGLVTGHAASCRRCAAEMQRGRLVLQELRRTPPAACPDAVFEAAVAQIARESRDRPAVPGRRRRLVGRAALAAVCLGAVITLGLLALQPRADEPTYSAEEVAEARQQIEFAFGFVGETGRNAGLYLREDVFPRHVVGPLGRTLTPQ